jgi:hypothetical protein
VRRVRKVEYTDAPLDHLLRHDEPDPAPIIDRRRDSWLPRAGLTAFLASAVAYAGFHIAGFAAPYPLILAVCAGAVLVRRAAAFTAEPYGRTRSIVRPPRRSRIVGRGWYYGDDGMLEAVRRWDRRLEWGATYPERFQHTMTGKLGEVVDERLRQRYGITRASDPHRARALVGEHVWTLTSEPVERVPSPRDVYQLVQRMESL